jgi:hypothetical protein
VHLDGVLRKIGECSSWGMQRSSLPARLRRLGFWAAVAFLVTFGVAMFLVAGNQQRQIHDLQSELRELQKDHRDLEPFVRNPPVRIDPLAARLP